MLIFHKKVRSWMLQTNRKKPDSLFCKLFVLRFYAYGGEFFIQFMTDLIVFLKLDLKNLNTAIQYIAIY